MSRGKYSEPHKWRRGLIVGHNHLGDVLYRTASLGVLHDALPACDWSYLTTQSSAPLLTANPNLHEVLPWSRGEDSWDLEASGEEDLRKREFDVILCTNTLHHYPDFFLGTQLRIPNRVGFTHKGLSGLINHPARIEFPSPYAGYFRSMVASVTGRAPDWPLKPQIFLSDADRSEGSRALRELGVAGQRPILACTFSTRQRHGNWPVEPMLGIIREAQSMADFEILLSGASSDASMLKAIANRIGGNIPVLAGEVSIRGFAAVIERCAALLCIDSGPRHIANAVGTPVFFARNMSHSRIEAGKYCDTETDIAPSGEYMSDTAIQRAATRISIVAAARGIARTIRGGAARA